MKKSNAINARELIVCHEENDNGRRAGKIMVECTIPFILVRENDLRCDNSIECLLLIVSIGDFGWENFKNFLN